MTADSAGATKPRSLQGHGPALLSTEASGRCWFSQATFAGAHGNGRDAPKIGIGGRLAMPPTGSPEAVARPRFPQNVACGFPALRSSEDDSQHCESL
jgi:hypothetical protein